ncbi:antibiotic biosynthesis monooxygenase family protein [Plantactinospora endophytica]|uniref:Antibiotic biosynthesis monooxygenase n=1 Tax=Plantactinospora endophytica TaxID=673535 RepID=A0ABQ4EBF3_9ACTN|nr:antibiotic biosynthesis monooxygenase family protein [Plantactinospora endophytica]GIG92063.1 antibiotic biosynthesis monooxygenase [Plantactinospora endophytica]
MTTTGRSAAPGGPAGRVRVLVWHRAPADGIAPVLAAYRSISRDLADTPGLLGNELLRAPGDPGSVVVASEWSSLDAFLAWERSAGHRTTTAPLRPFRDSDREPPYEVLEVLTGY